MNSGRKRNICQHIVTKTPAVNKSRKCSSLTEKFSNLKIMYVKGVRSWIYESALSHKDLRKHTHEIHAWMTSAWACDWLHFQALKRGGPVAALLLDNQLPRDKLFQLTFPRDPFCQMWQIHRRQATATLPGVGSKRRGQKTKFPTQHVRLDSSENSGDTSVRLIHKAPIADWSRTSTRDETQALRKPRERCQ